MAEHLLWEQEVDRSSRSTLILQKRNSMDPETRSLIEKALHINITLGAVGTAAKEAVDYLRPYYQDDTMDPGFKPYYENLVTSLKNAGLLENK